MSDGNSELTTPTTTESIASEVYESFESAEPSTETPAVETTPGTPAVETPATPGVVAPPLTEAETLLAADGYKTAKKPDGRDNYIPYSKVVKIIENGINQGKGQFGQKYQALETEANGMRPVIQRVSPILEAMDQGPEAMLAYAAQHDPRFKAYLETKTTPAAPVPLELPEPDFPLPDGSKTYSLKGIRESLIPFIVTQATKQAEMAAEAKLKPITEREQRAEHETAVRTRVRETIAEAETWPGFVDHRADIEQALKDDSAAAVTEGRRPKSLDAIYRQVVVGKLIQDDAAKRAQLIEEVNKANRATPTVVRSGAETPSVRAQTTHSIAAKTLERLERGA